jgi:HicB family
MDLSRYVEHLRAGLADAAAAGGEHVLEAAGLLATSLDAAVRMVLLEALSDAAAEITATLDGPSVEIRLRGRDPDFVVAPEPAEPAFAMPLPPPVTDGSSDDDAATSRITLRLPEPLKQRAEAAAAGARQSLNTWLVDAVRAAADESKPSRQSWRAGKQLSGWAH